MVHLYMEVSDMKKFILHIVIFITIVAAVDYAVGKIIYYLQANAGGRTGAEFYAHENATEDIIIMGSSRASHHYVPEIISQELGMSCFNVGQDGNGIILQYGRWKSLTKRQTPKLIIYDIHMGYDIETNDNMAYVDRLKPFSDDDDVNGYISAIFPLEKLKLLSQMYRYNYKFLEMTSDYIGKSDYSANAGYFPLFGHIRKDVADKQPQKKVLTEVDEVKIHYLEQLIKDANKVGTKVVFVVSPSWKDGNYDVGQYSIVKDLANKYGVPFWEYTNSDIGRNSDYFEDSSHLNDKGARIFTKLICARINEMMAL